MLLLKYKLISDVSVPKDVGSVLVILLFVKFIETMLLDEHNIPAHEDDWQGSPLGQNHEFLYLLISFMFEESYNSHNTWDCVTWDCVTWDCVETKKWSPLDIIKIFKVNISLSWIIFC